MIPHAPERRLAGLARDYAYVMPGFPLALCAFVVLVPLTVFALATYIVWIGALVLPFALLLASRFAQLSRARLRRWGVEPGRVAPPEPRPGFVGLLRRALDARRWLDLAFETLIAFPLRTVTFVVATSWTLGALGGLSYGLWAVFLPRDDTPLAGIILEAITDGAAPDALANSFALDVAFTFVIGAVLLVTLPLVMRGLALLDASTTAAALGARGRRTAAAGGSADRPGSAAAGPAVSGPADPGPGAPRLAAELSADGWSWIAAVAAAIVTIAVDWPVLAVLYPVPAAIAMLISFAHAAALLLAVRLPWAAIAAQSAAVAGTALAAAGTVTWPWPWPATTIVVQAVLLAIVALRHRWSTVAVAWAAPQILPLLVALVPPGAAAAASREAVAGNTVIVAAAVTLGVAAIGVSLRLLGASRGALQAARRTNEDLAEQRRESDERTRIAQELHDVVAHSMSVISVQATTAPYRLPGLDDAVAQEFDSIAQASRRALGEMRGLLALLRSPGEASAALAPQPTLDELPALIEATRRSGARIASRIAVGGRAVPTATALTAYRVVQEALSNAVRHAPGAEIRVTVDATGAGLAVEIVNGPVGDASGEQPPAPGAGLGLSGVAERVSAVGGTVETGATAEAGFRVRALLPLP
ncbi:sensor domain-containing protein [Leucobacter allii]|uniref:sensor histidine kinase n=1 Tax=Leucobacter allii TaxID=2932247 RepID=UPI001FCFE374|nr:sensor histidine kinase [Leucobacter allii]UOR00795.1 sensor domain-containing protein [Leucobacter allii]